MSRYVRVTAAIPSIQAAAAALNALGIAHEHNPRGVMLEGSLECPGEPVALRVAAGLADAVEDFGFSVEGGQVVLICGDVDREVLTCGVLAEVTEHCLRAIARDVPGVTVVAPPEVRITSGSERGSGSGGSASDG